MPETPQVTVRIHAANLAALEAIGAQIQPKPLNRSEMINVAIAEYVKNHAPPASARAARRRAPAPGSARGS